jgi:hypothetical protein
MRGRLLAMARADIEVSGRLFIEPDKSKGEASVKAEESEIVARFLRVRNLRSHKLLSQIGFIVGSYMEQVWYYEMWELARKALLVGVIAVINPGTVFQILIGLFVCMMSTFVSLILNPYKHPSDGWLNNICLVHLTLTLFLGLLLKMNVDIFGSEGSGDRVTSPDEAISWIIIMSHGALMAMSIFLFTLEIRDAPTYQRALRESEQRKREAVRKHIENWARGMRQQIQRDLERQRLEAERRGREEEDEKRVAEAKKHADEVAKKEREAARLKLEAEIKQMKENAKDQGLSKAEIDAKLRSIKASAA